MNAPYRTTQAELRIGEGGRPDPSPVVRIRFTPWQNEARTVLGTVDVEFTSGLQVFGFKLMVVGRGKRWIAFPAVPMIDRDGNTVRDARGKTRWSPVVDARDKPTREALQEAILEVVRRSNPRAFAG